jgi:hypothetical protein
MEEAVGQGPAGGQPAQQHKPTEPQQLHSINQ